LGIIMGSSAIPKDRCERCFQPVPPSAKRCPHCGERAVRASRNVTLILGICGAILLAIVVGLGLFLHGNPPDEGLPDDSAPAAQPAPAEKPPALDR
jgi:hypothetical protein